MSKITNLEDKNNNIVYPITVTAAVVMSDKTTKVEDAINARAKINVTDTDVGEGATLASGEFMAVYGEGGQVQTTDIANSAVNTAKLANNSVTAAKISADVAFIDADGTVETEDPWIGTSMVLWQQFLDKIYPVGSIYETTVYTTAAQVGAALGGTWTLIDEHELVAYASTNNTTSITSSKNIASITGSAAAWTVNFSKNMANANYQVAMTAEVGGVSAEIIGVYSKHVNYFNFDVSNSGGVVTPAELSILVFGKLATPEKYRYRRTA